MKDVDFPMKEKVDVKNKDHKSVMDGKEEIVGLVITVSLHMKVKEEYHKMQENQENVINVEMKVISQESVHKKMMEDLLVTKQEVMVEVDAVEVEAAEVEAVEEDEVEEEEVEKHEKEEKEKNEEDVACRWPRTKPDQPCPTLTNPDQP